MEKLILIHIITWLESVNAQFGVNHIVLNNKTYWLDTDLDEIYQLYKESN